jgi:hypothetical protein
VACYSESGISEPVYLKAGLAVNKEVYISNTSVYQYFINLSKKHHKNKKIVIWPDLASAHYAKDTLVRLKELKIECVPQEENPPNVPQIRPIENFGTNLKRKLDSKNYRPKDQKELKAIETTGFRKAIKEVSAKARKAHRLSVTFFCK